MNCSADIYRVERGVWRWSVSTLGSKSTGWSRSRRAARRAAVRRIVELDGDLASKSRAERWVLRDGKRLVL